MQTDESALQVTSLSPQDLFIQFIVKEYMFSDIMMGFQETLPTLPLPGCIKVNGWLCLSLELFLLLASHQSYDTQ